MHMRTDTFAKLFFCVSLSGLFMYGILAFYSFHTAYTTVYDVEHYYTPGLPKPVPIKITSTGRSNKLKNILVWTTPLAEDNIFGVGRTPFLRNNCTFTNCYLTANKQNMHDAILMDIAVLRLSRWKPLLPQNRSNKVIYIFHSMRSAEETPICNINADNYFNWTWSYKIYSDISTPYIEVKDMSGKVVAPRREVRWIEPTTKLPPIDIEKLKSKKKAVAWMPSTCQTMTNRFDFVLKLYMALRERSLDLDVYGCFFMGKMNKCPNDDCMGTLEKDYYFYLAYEGSHSEDFVTDEVLKAYHHNTVPIVLGGADYSYFLPEGSYMDATVGNADTLATLIDYTIRNPSIYHSLFQWKHNYTIDRADHDRGLCDLCQLLNNDIRMRTRSSYEKFRKWWYKDLASRCYPKGAEQMAELMSYINDTKRHKPRV